MDAGIRGEVVEAFDINDRANDVYEYNFGHRPCQVPLLFTLVHQLKLCTNLVEAWG